MIQILFSIRIYLTQLFEEITFFCFCFPNETKYGFVCGHLLRLLALHKQFWQQTFRCKKILPPTGKNVHIRFELNIFIWLIIHAYTCIETKIIWIFYKSKKSPMQKKVTTINYILLWTFKNHSIDGQLCMTFILQKVLSLKYGKRHAFLVFFYWDLRYLC